MTSVDEDFLAAITKPGLQPGQLLEPVKSAFGWHIIQIMYRPTDDAWLKGLKTKADGGADFATLARDNSERRDRRPRRRPRLGRQGPAREQQLTTRSSPRQSARRARSSIVVSDDGVYLFKVLAEETRTPEGKPARGHQGSSAFSNWYTLKKEAVIDHARRDHLRSRPASRPAGVLDALLAEARLRWGLDAAAGLQVVAAERLIATPDRAIAAGPARPARAAAADGRRGAVEPAATRAAGRPPRADGSRSARPCSRRLYPADHAVGRFGAAAGTTIGALTAEDLAAPALPGAARAGGGRRRALGDALDQRSPAPARRLPVGPRADPPVAAQPPARGGLRGLRRARGRARRPSWPDELGDLLLQVVLHAQLAAEAGVFDLADVQAALATKIVRRHPHVFGDAEAAPRPTSTASGSGSRPERNGADAGRDGRPRRARSTGSARPCPALAASQEMQERAAHLGYDWPSLDGVLDKVIEETEELRAAQAAGDDPGWAEEFGDLLFVLVNVARKRGVDAEAAMRAGQREVPSSVRQRGAAGRRAGRRPAGPRLPGARRAVGCGQGRGERRR